MFHETVEIVQRAWTQGRVAYEGEFYRIEDLSVRPKPLQKPHPPIWMASLSPETFRLCSRYGFNLMCAPVFGFDVNTGAHQIEEWRGSLREHGRDPASHDVAALVTVYVAETTQQALEDFRDPVMWYFHTFARSIAPPRGQGPVPSYEFYIKARGVLEVLDWEQVVHAGAVVCGSPEQVVDRLGEIEQRCGFTVLLAWTRIGGPRARQGHPLNGAHDQPRDARARDRRSAVTSRDRRGLGVPPASVGVRRTVLTS